MRAHALDSTIAYPAMSPRGAASGWLGVCVIGLVATSRNSASAATANRPASTKNIAAPTEQVADDAARRLAEQLAGDLPGKIASQHLLAPLIRRDVADIGHAERDDPGGANTAEATRASVGSRVGAKPHSRVNTPHSAVAIATQPVFPEPIAHRAGDQLHRAVRDRVGGDDDGGRADGDAEVGRDLRQQRIGRAHHGLAGEGGQREQRNGAGRTAARNWRGGGTTLTSAGPVGFLPRECFQANPR